MIKGTAPDGGKAVTLVLFTQGPALARLEFDSATGDATTDQFVTDIAKMQQIALQSRSPGRSRNKPSIRVGDLRHYSSQVDAVALRDPPVKL